MSASPSTAIKREASGLRFALEALDPSHAPAVFVVWQEDVDPAPILEICRSADAGRVETMEPEWLPRIFEGKSAEDAATVLVLPCGLSGIPTAERPRFNAARDRILGLGKKILFVENFREESALRDDYPDIFSVVRHSFHLEIIGDDYLFDNGSAGQLETLRAAYPPSFARGSVLFSHGKPSFKAAPKIECPNGHGFLKRGKTTISFQHAPATNRDQIVDGWVCPDCGESYVPGDVARLAHARAFQP
jgi:hypothetical protein